MRPTNRRDERPISDRRKFLKYSAGAAGLALLGGIGYQFRPVQSPEFLSAPLSEGPSLAPKLLVVYASMMGATGTQAAEIAQIGRDAGYRTRLAKVDEAPDPAEFDAVMMGSAIKGSAWLPEMQLWAGQHEVTLAARPHALFQCSMQCAGLMLQGHSDGQLSAEDIAILSLDLTAIYDAAPSLAAAPVAFLPGRLDYDLLQPALRIAYPLVAGTLLRGDFRRPDMSRDFARDVLSGPGFSALPVTGG